MSVTASEALDVLEELVRDIEDTGGLIEFENGEIAPAADEEWLDLVTVVIKARDVLRAAGREVTLTIHKTYEDD